MHFYRQIWYYLKGFRLVMGLALLCAVGHTVLTLVPALFVREVVGRIEQALGAGAAQPGWTWLAGWSMGGILGALALVYLVRALLHCAPIIILDEATSSVEKTDRICVLEHGRLVEQGTHRELMAQGGIYARLQGRQFGTAAAGL